MKYLRSSEEKFNLFSLERLSIPLGVRIGAELREAKAGILKEFEGGSEGVNQMPRRRDHQVLLSRPLSRV